MAIAGIARQVRALYIYSICICLAGAALGGAVKAASGVRTLLYLWEQRDNNRADPYWTHRRASQRANGLHP